MNCISSLARLGSGSACRSVFGGFVQWITGTNMNTSVARQIVDEHAWPEVRVLVLVVSDDRKDTSSTSGMQLSSNTSSLIKYRTSHVVPIHVDQMINAINQRDFHSFAEITMKDSNQFHAICQDTYPPIRYMNDTSWSVVHFIHFYNKFYGKNVACYTFDAGPNACLYCLKNYVPELITLLSLLYSISSETSVKGIKYQVVDKVTINQQLLDYVEKFRKHDAIKCVISTKIGSGPQIISNEVDEFCLLTKNGEPKL